MPSELLHFPPAYTVVGLYRLLTDASIRTPVLDKIKHASVRGAIVALLYAAGSWRILDWLIRRFLIGGGGFLGLGRGKVGEAVKESVGGVVQVGLDNFSFNLDLVFCRSYSHHTAADPRHTSSDPFTADLFHIAVLHLQEPQARPIKGLCLDRFFPT